MLNKARKLWQTQAGVCQTRIRHFENLCSLQQVNIFRNLAMSPTFDKNYCTPTPYLKNS